jgi:hypothetical protein
MTNERLIKELTFDLILRLYNNEIDEVTFRKVMDRLADLD